MEQTLPPIPVKRYFTIGEVGELCGVKPHVLRYWEQEFTQLRPMKRRGNRRYYQHHEVLMIRRIRELLYDQGFTISGARNRLQELVHAERDRRKSGAAPIPVSQVAPAMDGQAVELEMETAVDVFQEITTWVEAPAMRQLQQLRRELAEIRELLTV